MLEAITPKVDRSAVRRPNGEKVARSFADMPVLVVTKCQWRFDLAHDDRKGLLRALPHGPWDPLGDNRRYILLNAVCVACSQIWGFEGSRKGRVTKA